MRICSNQAQKFIGFEVKMEKNSIIQADLCFLGPRRSLTSQGWLEATFVSIADYVKKSIHVWIHVWKRLRF